MVRDVELIIMTVIIMLLIKTGSGRPLVIKYRVLIL
jgi:hypothetical protein